MNWLCRYCNVQATAVVIIVHNMNYRLDNNYRDLYEGIRFHSNLGRIEANVELFPVCSKCDTFGKVTNDVNQFFLRANLTDESKAIFEKQLKTTTYERRELNV